MWGNKIWARDLGPGTTFRQQYARGEEITGPLELKVERVNIQGGWSERSTLLGHDVC